MTRAKATSCCSLPEMPLMSTEAAQFGPIRPRGKKKSGLRLSMEGTGSVICISGSQLSVLGLMESGITAPGCPGTGAVACCSEKNQFVSSSTSNSFHKVWLIFFVFGQVHGLV